MAWTIVESIDRRKNINLLGGTEVLRVKLVCTADAAGVDYDLTSASVKGSYLYMVKTVPGTAGDAPSGVYQVQIQDDEDTPLLTLAGLSTTATEINAGSVTIGVFPPILEKCSFVVNDQVGDGNKITVYLYFTK